MWALLPAVVPILACELRSQRSELLVAGESLLRIVYVILLDTDHDTLGIVTRTFAERKLSVAAIESVHEVLHVLTRERDVNHMAGIVVNPHVAPLVVVADGFEHERVDMYATDFVGTKLLPVPEDFVLLAGEVFLIERPCVSSGGTRAMLQSLDLQRLPVQPTLVVRVSCLTLSLSPPGRVGAASIASTMLAQS